MKKNEYFCRRILERGHDILLNFPNEFAPQSGSEQNLIT